MKRTEILLATLFLLVPLAALAQSNERPGSDKASPSSANDPLTVGAQSADSIQTLKADCDAYIAVSDNVAHGNLHAKSVDQISMGLQCMRFVAGYMNESAEELWWKDSRHKSIVVGSWRQDVTTDRMIRAFIDYASPDVEKSNLASILILRFSAEAGGLYTYKPAQWIASDPEYVCLKCARVDAGK